MKQILVLICALLAAHAPAATALESDRDQPAIIDADGVDIDFASGLRVYYGNVRLRQGTLKLDADKLEVRFEDDKVQTAVAVGEPAVFRQRPDGKDADVIGEALFIHLDETENVITLTRDAVVTQGADRISGRTIVYDMANDKVRVRSGSEGQTRTTKGPEGATEVEEPASESEPIERASTESAPSGDGDPSEAESTEPAVDGESRRPRIILKPKDAE